MFLLFPCSRRDSLGECALHSWQYTAVAITRGIESSIEWVRHVMGPLPSSIRLSKLGVQ